MNKPILAVVAVVALCGTAKADLSFSTSLTVSSWLNSPLYTSLAANVATTPQGNPSLGSGAANYVLSETFTAGSSYTLGQIDILAGSTTAGTLSLHLYDVTGGSGVTGANLLGSGGFYIPGTDLFGNGSGLSFSVSGTGGEQQYIFSLSNGSTSDQVSLIAGDVYALEIWTPAAIPQNNFQWYRGGSVATDGQMMGSHDSLSSVSRNTIAALGLAGGAPRTASLALYAVPEPATMALLGLGALGALVIRRRK